MLSGDIPSFLSSIGEEVEDADEESFLLFSQNIPTSNLGFVNSKSPSVELSIHDHEYTIHQSPTLLSSKRAGGTTGAVLWKITPLFAEWLSDKSSNPLWTGSNPSSTTSPSPDPILTPSSVIVELGCGISALTALALSPCLEQGGHYLATDQEYVHRLFRQNLQANPPRSTRRSGGGGKPSGKGKGKQKTSGSSTSTNTSECQAENPHSNITFTSLDWETDIPDTLKQQIPSQPSNSTHEDNGSDKGFDLLLSCDCIYNEALIAPFVRTCADIARLRPLPSSPSSSEGTKQPTICIIAQQQRSPDVFEAWLRETMRYFRVWRLGEDVLGRELGVGSGYLVHALVLR